MVNVDLITVPPTSQEFEKSESNSKKIFTSFVVVLCAHYAFFLGEVALTWFLGKVTSEQVYLIVCVNMASLLVSLFLSNHVRQFSALSAGVAVGIISFAFIGLPFQFESQVLLAILSSGAGVVATYILNNIVAMQHEIERVMTLDDSDYTWLCLAAQGSPFITNYLLQVRYSGREDIYREELLQIMPHAPENIDVSWADSIGDPKMGLWAFLDTIG